MENCILHDGSLKKKKKKEKNAKKGKKKKLKIYSTSGPKFQNYNYKFQNSRIWPTPRR